MLALTGLASSTVPMYIAECAPAHQRGKLVTVNNLFITGGQFTASIVAGLFSYDYNTGWRYVFSVIVNTVYAESASTKHKQFCIGFTAHQLTLNRK